MNKVILIFITLFLAIPPAFGQMEEDFPIYRNAPFSLGFGLGLDYGGLGARASYIIANRVSLFGGIGYNFNGAGYNFGGAIRILPDKKVTPYFCVMYGYNAVINVSGSVDFQKTYYGTSIGAGIELKSRNQPNFWSFGILLPFRDPAYERALDDLKAMGVNFDTEPWPIGISIGYHFGLR